MNVLIIGGVAAGTKIAAKLRREDPGCSVNIITKGSDISYAGCGLPYYVSNVIKERAELVVNTPESFYELTGAKVFTRCEAIELDRISKSVIAVNLVSGEKTVHNYDKLVIATGARPIVPNCVGTDLKNVFYMRTPDDAVALRSSIESGAIKRAVIVGAGLIGLELADALLEQGVRVSVIDMASHVLPEFLDPEISDYVENKMADAGVSVFTGVSLEGIEGEDRVERVITSKRPLKTDTVILAMGFRPNTDFVRNSGLEMFKGTLIVDEHMRTSDPDIYSAGDCAMVTNRLTGKRQWSAMGSTANISGRIAAINIADRDHPVYTGVLGTGVAKLPGTSIGRTGLSESAARGLGYNVETAISIAEDKAHYYPGSGLFITKLICDRDTRRLLGMQVVGSGAVDKMTDIAVASISLNATLEDLQCCDFAYTPPFSTAIHPFAVAVNVLLNKLDGRMTSFTPIEYSHGKAAGYRLVDASIAPSIDDAPYIDLNKLDHTPEGLSADEKLLLVCSKGKRAYMVQNRLKYYGFNNTRVLEGGTIFNDIKI